MAISDASTQLIRGAQVDWPFHDPPNVFAFTTGPVLEDGHAILYGLHDDIEEGWHFTCGTRTVRQDPRIVTLQVLYQMDPSIGELADLPYGWCASRIDQNARWQRAQRPKAEELQHRLIKTIWREDL